MNVADVTDVNDVINVADVADVTDVVDVDDVIRHQGVGRFPEAYIQLKKLRQLLLRRSLSYHPIIHR